MGNGRILMALLVAVAVDRKKNQSSSPDVERYQVSVQCSRAIFWSGMRTQLRAASEYAALFCHLFMVSATRILFDRNGIRLEGVAVDMLLVVINVAWLQMRLL